MPLCHMLLLCLAVAAPQPTPVVVDYAASLTATMEGPIAAALLREQNVRFQGEGKGSKALANMIAAGLRTPDVFVSADPALVEDLEHKNLIASSAILGSASMVLGFAPSSPHAAQLQAAGGDARRMLDALDNSSLRLGRTDPAIDPKGSRTVRALEILGTMAGEPEKAQRILRAAQIFPEEDLAVRVQTGELDAGFFYSLETGPAKLRAVDLPGDASLRGKIQYSIAILKAAAHPDAARSFVAFVLHGAGRSILRDAGLR